MPMSDYVRSLRTQIGSNLLHMPSVSTALFDTESRLLMAQQAGSSLWMTVGGANEPDESPSDAAVREMWVETGLHMVPVRVLGVFGGREFRVNYPNGDETAYTVILFEVRLLGERYGPTERRLLPLVMSRLIPGPIDQNLSPQSRRPSESHPSRSRLPRHESTKPGSGMRKPMLFRCQT